MMQIHHSFQSKEPINLLKLPHLAIHEVLLPAVKTITEDAQGFLNWTLRIKTEDAKQCSS